jgi:peptide methionine sulfoxide reductase MsrA
MITRVSIEEWNENNDMYFDGVDPIRRTPHGSYLGFIYDNGIHYKADTHEEAVKLSRYHTTIWKRPDSFDKLKAYITLNNRKQLLESI